MSGKTLTLMELKPHTNFRLDATFARDLGIPSQNSSVWLKQNTFNKNNIVDKFPEVSKYWLLTGEGEMLKNENLTTLLLPIAAQAGKLNDFVASIKKEDCETVISPIKNIDFALRITGDSMAPEYPSGSQIFVKKINEKAFIEWGRVYVLDTCNGTIIKKILPGVHDESYRCESINTAYPTFEINTTDVYGMYRVLLCMAIK